MTQKLRLLKELLFAKRPALTFLTSQGADNGFMILPIITQSKIQLMGSKADLILLKGTLKKLIIDMVLSILQPIVDGFRGQSEQSIIRLLSQEDEASNWSFGGQLGKRQA